jgi:flagellar motor switch protein FliN/FliY|tara:strand:- start:569 stop:856 length:288 start_codon:yes stop_codon:yes gene_type:complete
VSKEIEVDISVVIGATPMPIGQLLKVEAGAIFDLTDGLSERPVAIYADDELIAHGQVVRRGDTVGVEVTERVNRPRPVPVDLRASPPAWMKLTSN